MFWKASGAEGARAAKGTPRGRAVGPGVVLEAEKGFGLDQLRASKERVLPPAAENLRQQILKVGEMPEDGAIPDSIVRFFRSWSLSVHRRIPRLLHRAARPKNLKPGEVDTKPKWLERFLSTKEY